jgi:hypothetical protein
VNVENSHFVAADMVPDYPRRRLGTDAGQLHHTVSKRDRLVGIWRSVPNRLKRDVQTPGPLPWIAILLQPAVHQERFAKQGFELDRARDVIGPQSSSFVQPLPSGAVELHLHPVAA